MPARLASWLTLTIAVGLLTQFTLGMIVNLYVAVPSSHPGAKAGDYFSGIATSVPWAIEHATWALALHAALGCLVGLSAIALVALAIRNRHRGHVAATLLGALFTIAAGFNGASFLNYGHALSSLLMSIFFALALSAYIAALYLSLDRAAG